MLSRIGRSDRRDVCNYCTLLSKMHIDISRRNLVKRLTQRKLQYSSYFLFQCFFCSSMKRGEKEKENDVKIMWIIVANFYRKRMNVQILLRGSVDWKRDWKFVERNWKVAGEIWPRTNIGRQMDEERPRTGDWNWQTDVKKYPAKPDRLKSACTSYDAFYLFFSFSLSLV